MTIKMASQILVEKKIPKYVKVAMEIKSEIERGLFEPNEQLPSFNDMTERYQITKHTIDKVHAVLEKEGLVRREHGRGVFVQPQRRKQTGNIGLLLWGITSYSSRGREPRYDTFACELMASVQQQAGVCGMNVMLIGEQENIAEKNIDGILIFADSTEMLSLEIPDDMPRVLLLSPAPGVEIANVTADDFTGAKMATEHLLSLGHRRISFMMSAEDDHYSNLRLAGYKAALASHGVPFDDKLCIRIHEDINSFYGQKYALYGREYMRGWLAAGWRELNSTAIMALNDSVASGVIQTLQQMNIRVPEDISIVGFDGVLPMGDIDLTTVQVPLREIGTTGMRMLHEQIQTQTCNVVKKTLPVTLNIGKTTAQI